MQRNVYTDRFYIEKLIVSGGGHEASVIDFMPGLNFIIGPSNTGKSLVSDCIDYAFGFEPRKEKPSRIVDNSYGYECIALHLRTADGTVILERKIGANKISVSGTDPNYEHISYGVSSTSKQYINQVFLQLLGLKEFHEVQASLKGSKQRLTWRTMMNIFLVKQTDVARETSILINKAYPSPIPSQATLLFLMSGMDANNLITPESKTIREAKKKALMSYINDKVQRLTARVDELQEIADAGREPDLKATVNAINTEIESIQSQINASIEKSKRLMDSIYEQNGKLTECDTMVSRFNVLRQQYESDIERLGFVVEGELNRSGVPIRKHCPFCDSVITTQRSTSYLDATKAELSHIKTHLIELETAQTDLNRKRNVINNDIHRLETEKANVDALIANRLVPRVSALKDKLDDYRRAIQLNSEIEVIQSEQRQYASELFEHETTSLEKDARFEIIERFDRADIGAYEDVLISILKASKIGAASTARLNMKTFDIELNGYNKAATMGGGFCGILNTIVALAMTKYLQGSGKPAPGFFFVDSSLTQLSESEHKENANTIKYNFIQYLINNALDSQVIIVEQKKRLPFMPTEDKVKGVHVIEFTEETDIGRYGFLNDVANPK